MKILTPLAALRPLVLALLLSAVTSGHANVPQLINYQGRIVSNGTNFTGPGQFKFSLINGANGPSLWASSNPPGGTNEPANPVTVPVVNGLYSVLLGDTNLPNMAAIPLTVFAISDVRLRVWFNDGRTGWQQLSPDQRLAAAGYALMAAAVPDRAITSAKLAAGAVGASSLANNSVSGAKLADGAITTSKLADGVVTASKVAQDFLAAVASNATVTTFGSCSNCARVHIMGTDSCTPAITLDGCENEVKLFSDSGKRRARLVADDANSELELFDAGPDFVLRPVVDPLTGATRLFPVSRWPAATIAATKDGRGGYLQLLTTDNQLGLTAKGNGNAGGGEFALYNDQNRATIVAQAAEGAGKGGQFQLYNGTGGRTVQIDGDANEHNRAGYVAIYNSLGRATTRILGEVPEDDAKGRIVTDVLQITGGADLSENFDIASSATAIQPGLIVAIDAAHPGQLTIATRAYDRTVAGIVSGAGGVEPGMLMGQRGTRADGKHPVALTGRVYAWMDADAGGAIVPGDLITSSNTPGHGMKAGDHTASQGAIIGKAMTPLAHGKGLVLVLVSLQ